MLLLNRASRRYCPSINMEKMLGRLEASNKRVLESYYSSSGKSTATVKR